MLLKILRLEKSAPISPIIVHITSIIVLTISTLTLTLDSAISVPSKCIIFTVMITPKNSP